MFKPELHGLDLDKEGKSSTDNEGVGIGLDSSVIPLKNDLQLVQTVDFFYPLIDDPHMLGRIALANVVSDVYAVGALAIDEIKLVCSAPTEFSEAERDIVVPMIIRGFQEAAVEAKCPAKIGSIALNPWCIIGGIATAVCHKSELIMPYNAQPGDALVLTKPLGTQLATNAFIWMTEEAENWNKLAAHLTPAEVERSYAIAVESMSRLNRSGAELMHKFGAHAATDVTGFGLFGHAENLLKFQKADVDFELDTLPIIRNVVKIAEILGRTPKLMAGKAVETSGGLLVSLPAENAEKFCAEYRTVSEHDAWIIGKVVPGSRVLRMSPNPTVISVD
ncbi:hypothetical protein quinque_006586 [Culex quinquefasciatus]